MKRRAWRNNHLARGVAMQPLSLSSRPNEAGGRGLPIPIRNSSICADANLPVIQPTRHKRWGFLRIGRNPRNRRQDYQEMILGLLQNEQSTPMTGLLLLMQSSIAHGQTS
jgi:hypothetical protein